MPLAEARGDVERRAADRAADDPQNCNIATPRGLKKGLGIPWGQDRNWPGE